MFLGVLKYHSEESGLVWDWGPLSPKNGERGLL
jgi:hypothetical protein